ncbi:MAG: hypothetical protein CFE23_09040, partial [Flavobacterium sp. BFFFF1]|uniref:Ig-like domain-containing protein n=1 Tax=Flavobacterium sp. BFFFF1 TaxID=2015557 RepID=UPI000BCEDAA6
MFKNYNSPAKNLHVLFSNAFKKNFILGMLFFLFTAFTMQAQISVTVTNPGNTTPALASSYTSLASALTDLNAVTAMSGPIVLTCASGTSETAPVKGMSLGSASLNAVLSATNTITINKSSSGAVTINAGVGTSNGPSASPDGMLYLDGADFVTIDGLTFTDGNTASATVAMEYGIAFFKRSAGDGCNSNTIQNCVFNMQRINNAVASGPLFDGSWAISVLNSTAAAAATALTPTNGGTLATNGTNSNNKFYSNTINGGNGGIALSGFAATAGVGPTPTATTFLGDLGNDIGGVGSVSATTGNTVLNFGGGAATNAAAGIRANNQWSVNISNNVVNNNNGSGVNHGTTLRGIYAQAGTSANATITYNTLTIKSSGTTASVYGIDNGIGTTAASNTININNNTITNSTYATATTGSFFGINTSSSAANVNTNFNQITNNSIGTSGTASTCLFYGVYNAGASTNYTANSNTISGITLNNSFNTFYGIRGSTSVITVDGNTVSSISMPNMAGATTCVLYGYYDVSSPVTETVTNNNFMNFSMNGSSTATLNAIYGIYNLTAAGTKNFSGNNINNLTFNSSSTGSASVAGIRNAYNTVATISKNVIHGLSSSGTTPTVAGIYLGSTTATTFNVSNNLIGNLSTPQSTGHNLYGIFCGTVGTNMNLYYNTIYLNATSSGTGFGSSAVFQSSTVPSVLMNNNILVNLSTPTGTGISSCFRRTSTTLTQYASASNNNLFYAGTPSAAKLLFYDGTNLVQAMSAYKTLVSPRESLSFSEAVSATPGTFFQSLTGPASGTSSTFLHLVNGLSTQAEGGGIAISGYADDYDGNTRNVSTPDVGADEFSGVSPAPSVVLTSVSPAAAPQCSAVSRAVDVNVTTNSGTISGVTLNYSFNGVAQTPIAMASGAGNSYTGTIPAATPTNAVVTWSVTATNSLSLSATYSGTAYGDDPLNGYAQTATATVSTVCAGAPTVLKASAVKTNSNVTLGTGLTTIGTTSTSEALSPLSQYYESQHTQYLLLASDLQATGLAAGNLTALRFNVTTKNSTKPFTSYTIKLSTTALTTLTSGNNTGSFTTVYASSSTVGAGVSTTAGINTFAFGTGGTASSFNWDGSSNLLVDICFANDPSNTGTFYSNTDIVAATTKSYVATYGYNLDNANLCGTTGANITSSSKLPDMTFTGTVGIPLTGITWSDGVSSVGSGNNLSVAPTTTTTYTFTANYAGCPVTANTSVTVNPLPTAPTATNSSQCGLDVPTASVADPNGFTTPTFKWYADNVTTTALQATTSNTYATAISTTTTFYVSVVNPTTGCESSRTPVTVNVTSPAAIVVTPGATTSVCLGATISLGASSANPYSYSWTVSPLAGSGMSGTLTGPTQSVQPTVPGTYVYTVFGDDTVCATTNTVIVTVNPLPAITSAAASLSTVCAGTPVTLTALSTTLTNVNATIGTQTTTIGGDNGNPYRSGNGSGNQIKTQLLYKASELTAAGFSAGTISGLGFTVTSTTGTLSNFTINMAHSNATALTTTYETPSFTTVFTQASFTPAVGVNMHTFSTPFNWDGVSNVIVQICQTNSAVQGTTTVACSTPAFAGNTHSATSTTACSLTSGTAVAARPIITFAGQTGTDLTSNFNWVWNPGNLSGNSVTVNPVSNTVYTVTATNPTTLCSIDTTVSVTVNAKPLSVTSTGSSQCGVGVPTAAVVDPNGFTSPTIKWYADNVTTTALQSGTSTTYLTSIAATTTFYVSVTNPVTGCESDRTAVIVNVITPDPLTLSIPSGNKCADSAFSLTTSYTPTTNLFATFTLTASPSVGSGVSGSVALVANASGANPYAITPTAAGTYTYTVSAYDPDTQCTSVKTVTVTVDPLPVLTLSATPSTICAGNATTILATTPAIAPGTTALGTAVTTTAVAGITPYTSNWEGQRIQYIVKASELTAAGLYAGNITSLGFKVTASGAGTNPQSGFSIKIANTADIAFAGAYATPSGSFTTVYGPVSKAAPGIGTDTMVFTTPFNWDGISNIVIDICHDNDTVADTCASCFSSNSTVEYTATTFNSVFGRYADNNSLCGTVNGTTISTFTNRPNMIFGGQINGQGAGNLTYSWSDGTATVSSSNTFSASPTTTTVYTVTATNPGTSCSSTQSVTVTVNPAPTAPVATNGGRCGAGIVTNATVADSNGFVNPTFKWYSASSGGTALQSSTSTNYLAPLSTTTTFYVSVVNPTTSCESPRAMIVLTIDSTPSANINYSASPYCNTLTSVSVTMSGTTGGSYIADSGLSLNPTTGEVNPSASIPGTYQVTYTMDGGYCGIQTATASITISANPSSAFNYPLAVYCSSSNTANPTISGSAGTFTAVPSGLAINASTGVIDLTSSAEGTYTVTNTVVVAGCATSTTDVTVTVNKAVVITGQPQGVSILPADNTSFTVAATGTGISAYVWEMSTDNGGSWTTVSNGGVYSGATTDTLTLTNVTSGMNQYQYRVTVSGTSPCSSATSNAAILTVSTISINLQPQSQTICSNSGVTFSIGTAGGTPSSYQWQYRVNSSGTFADIPGANSSSYTISSGLTSANTGNQYQCIVNGGFLTSNIATLTVNDVVAITVNPNTQSVCSNTSSVTFNVAASGTGLTYQWESSTDDGANWSAISGETSNAYVINSPSVSLSGRQFRAVVSGTAPCVSMTSSPATLTVTQAVAITGQPSSQAICASATASFSVAATGAGLTYQWIANNGSDIILSDGALSGATISGATSSSLSIASASALSGYTFRVQVSGIAPCGPVTSNTVNLFVLSGGTIAIGPGGVYNNLTSAIAALATCGITQPTTLELNAGYDASTETYPIVLPNISGSSVANTLTIREAGGVTGKVITSSNAVATFSLNGANYWTIDGRSGGVGTTRDLQVSNSNVAGNAILFINDASNNAIRYVDVRGVNTSVSSGVVLFSTTTGASGNDNNTIANCDIHEGASTPTNGVYSSGTASKTNDNNTLSNNNIYNYFSATLATKGIAIASNSDAWTISGNRLYQTATRLYTAAQTHNGINVAAGSGYTITGNVIGFANASGTGSTNLVGNSVALTGTFPSAYTTTGTANATRFIGLNLGFTAAGTVSSIQNNTVAGIALYTSSGATTTNGVLCGINITSGNANVGTVTGNTIGATSGTGSLYAAASTSGAAVVGIYTTSTNTVSIQNNTIGAIDASGTTAGAITGSITGIDAAGTGVLTISNNTVGHSGANNLRAGSFFNGTNLTNSGAITFVNTAASNIEGIRSSSSGSSTTISSNIVRNATAYGTGGSIVNGIDNTGAATLVTAASNTVSDVANAGTGAFTGMTLGSPTTANVTANTINNLSRTGAGTFYGIQYGLNTTITIDGNTISNLSSNATGSTSGFYGIYSVSSPVNESITNNSIFNLTTTATGAQNIVGWYQLTTNSGVKNCTGNTIYNFTAPATSSVVMYGIRSGYGPTVTLSRNTIYGFSGGLTQFGIFSSTSAAGTTSIFRNKIYDLSTANTGAAQIIGLALASTTASANVNAYNNLIGDLRATAASNLDAIRGISVTATSTTATVGLYNNTVYLNASSSGSAFGTTGIYHTANATATTAKLDLLNNIVINTSTPGTTGFVSALRRSAAATLGNFATTSNRNMYFAGTPAANKVIMYDGTNAYQDYTAYFGVVGTTRESNSFVDNAFSAATFFNSVVGSSATYLKPNDGINTLAESGGSNLSSLFTVDYNGVARGSLYDMGAWEFAGSSPAPTIVLNAVTPAAVSQCTATARDISVEVTTPSGTITSVTLTYNNGTATGPVAMTNTAGNTWTYTIPAASPVNSVVTWSVTAVGSSGLSTVYTGASYQDALNTGLTMSAVASVATVCSGSPTVLSAVPVGTTTPFTNGFETAITSFTSANAAGTVSLTQNTTYASEGTKSLYLNTASFSADVSASMTNSVNLSSLPTAYLTFSHIAALEGPTTSFDYGYVQYSSDGGTTWVSFPTTSYIGSATLFNGVVSFSTKSYANWIGAFTSTTSTPTNALWQNEVLAIPAAALTSQFKVRFRYTTDTTQNYYGWLIDNVKISNAYTTATPTAYSWSDGSAVVGTTNNLTVNPNVTTTYTLTATLNNCVVVSNPVTVTVNSPAVAGTISGATSVCSGTNSTTLTLNGNTGTIQWQSSADNNTFANISGATGTTYNAVNLSATTYYRAVVTSGVCTPVNSPSVAITITPSANGGTVSGTQVVCSGTTPMNLTLSGNVGSVVRWEKSSDIGFTSPTTINNTTTTLTGAEVGAVTATTYIRAVVQSGTCGTANSTVATISTGNTTTWTVAGGWDNGAPTSTSAAIINGNYTAAADLNACTLTVQSGTVLVTGGFD